MKILSTMFALLSFIILALILMPELAGYGLIAIALGVIVRNYRVERKQTKHLPHVNERVRYSIG